jgi:hypothetical protein
VLSSDTAKEIEDWVADRADEQFQDDQDEGEIDRFIASRED